MRARLDWKYALSLELTDAGFHYSVLCEFWLRLVKHEKSQLLLDEILTIFKEKGWIKARGQQRTDSTHLLACVRELNQIEVVVESFRQEYPKLVDRLSGTKDELFSRLRSYELMREGTLYLRRLFTSMDSQEIRKRRWVSRRSP